jgi:hypothetical protein
VELTDVETSPQTDSRGVKNNINNTSSANNMLSSGDMKEHQDAGTKETIPPPLLKPLYPT